MVVIRLAFLVGIVLLGQAARAQIGFSGSSISWTNGLVIVAMLVTFTGLTLWGFFSGLDALLPPPSLPPQRRIALRWIGLNRLEPSVTSLLIVILFGVRMRSEIFDSPFSVAWFALPVLTFLIALLPPVWFRSPLDSAVQDTWRGLRWVALARGVPYLLIGLGFLFNQEWLIAAAMVIGLGNVFWSLWLMARLAAQLYTFEPPSQPVPSSQRMDANAQ